ncbi:hypothetical protein JTE90_009201 [Oedothorax gibbosus]|uniref:EGF-like domain-containing protein n=1 Tax=Oedothorax gibbosus TaxID=931172 RepID=A0AAV6UYL8_9ARAC|nr:hypothetical protein JTE90_009201 [Oedothorax gibbosus]
MDRLCLIFVLLGSCKCKNGGECMFMRGTESCNCKPPYDGPTCEEDPCHPNPCKNNQSCSLTRESFSCNCNESYSGLLCDGAVDLCPSKTCRFGETCKTVYGVPTCFQEMSTLSTTEKLSTNPQNESRTTEENSESTIGNKDNSDTETQSITEEYLSNSSLVTSITNTTFDELNKLATESEASSVTDDISTEGDYDCNCKNGGQCIYESCSCEPPYEGPTCEEDPCHPNPCENNQSCSLTRESFNCDCNDSYSGKFCEQEISTSSTTLSTTEKLPATTPDEPKTTKENSESSTTGNEDNTDIETQSSNEPTFTKRANDSTPNTESDEYSDITEEYLSNSSQVNSTVNLVVATDVISYENATSTIFPNITNISFDELNKLPTESDVSNVSDDISTEVGIDVCQEVFCRNGGICKKISGKAKCDCTEFYTGPICGKEISTTVSATSTHLPTTTDQFKTKTENSESTNDSKYNATTEPQSTETTSEDLISSNGSSSVETFTDDLKTTTENTASTSDNEKLTTIGSQSPDTTSDESISSNDTSSVGTTTANSKTTTEITASTSDNEEVTTRGFPSPDTTSDESISSNETSSVGTTTADSKATTENTSSTSPDITSDDIITSNRPSSYGTTTDNSNIITENIYSTTRKEDNTTPDSLTSETTQSIASTNTDDTVTEVEIDKKKVSKRNVAYICGGIGGGLGIISFIAGITYYLKRLKKIKHLLYFKSADSSSMGSSDSTSHLA